MPAASSDIHESSVLYFFTPENGNTFSFVKFSNFSNKISNGKITITEEDFQKYKNTFQRGLYLAQDLQKKIHLNGKKLEWIGLQNHKKDSADVIIDGRKISLKDESKIVRNNGFEQLLTTFRKDLSSTYKDPFFLFSPKLSAEYLHTVFRANIELGYLKKKEKMLFLDGLKFVEFEGALTDLYKFDLKLIAKTFKAKDIKELVKRFKGEKYQKELLDIRLKIVSDVSRKVVAVLQEGVHAKDNHVDEQFKDLFQYTDEVKYFGFSSSEFNHVGVIVPKDDVFLTVKRIYTTPSKLREGTTGLQINLYTDIEVSIKDQSKKLISVENQLRYKHRTFSCAPEANTHLTSYDSWKDIYPLIKKFI